MSKVVLDVSMSLDGFTAGPNIRVRSPWETAANGYTSGMQGRRRTARSTSASSGSPTERWGRPHRTAYLRPWLGPMGRHAVARGPELCGHPPDQG
jgi:hypothetical protein